jgi:hypothetical protein
MKDEKGRLLFGFILPPSSFILTPYSPPLTLFRPPTR